MEINTNLSINGVDGSIAAKRATPTSNMPSDRVSLTNSSALDQALQNTPDSRPDMVARAQSLIADPNYPSSETLSAVARQLAGGFLADKS
jgi:hypothetical protein